MSTNPILVGVDPERDDRAPLVLGAALARVTGAPLMVVGAYLHDPITNAVSSGTVDADLRSSSLSRLEALTDGMDVDLFVSGGPSAARVLHDASARLSAQMLVVGSTTKGRLGRLAPGSTAERLLQGAPCPVAVATAGLGADWAPRRIGAAFIDLEESHGALIAAAALARAAGGALQARTAIDPNAWRQSAVITPYHVAGDVEPSVTAAQRALDRAIEELPAGTTASGDVVLGQPADALSEFSEELDLLVCGSRGYGGLRAVLLGGVTHALLRTAHCPIVVVPRGTENTLTQLDAQAETSAP